MCKEDTKVLPIYLHSEELGCGVCVFCGRHWASYMWILECSERGLTVELAHGHAL